MTNQTAAPPYSMKGGMLLARIGEYYPLGATTLEDMGRIHRILQNPRLRAFHHRFNAPQVSLSDPKRSDYLNSSTFISCDPSINTTKKLFQPRPRQILADHTHCFIVWSQERTGPSVLPFFLGIQKGNSRVKRRALRLGIETLALQALALFLATIYLVRYQVAQLRQYIEVKRPFRLDSPSLHYHAPLVVEYLQWRASIWISRARVDGLLPLAQIGYATTGKDD